MCPASRKSHRVPDLPHSVKHYSTATGCLTLEHDFPVGSSVVSLVDVNLLLEHLTEEKTRVGEWVNVTGYVTAAKRCSPLHVAQDTSMRVPVQALLLWSAGPLDLQRYECTVSAMKSQPSSQK